MARGRSGRTTDGGHRDTQTPRNPLPTWLGASVLGSLLVAGITAALFARVLGYPFLNWDDQDVFVRNAALRAPGLLQWAFTTRYMEHYQPLAWLAWVAAGVQPATAHALNLGLHVACAVCVYVLARAGLKAGPYDDVSYTDVRSGRTSGRPDEKPRDAHADVRRGRPSGRPDIVAAFAALFWAIHPLRVEVVAWASAMPYALALLCALLATLAWIQRREWTALALLALSLLARPIALGVPFVWIAFGPVRSRRTWGPALAGALLAIAFAAIESSARLTVSVSEFGLGPRLTLAATAPFVYLWRTVWPVHLTPLDPLALTPRTDVALVLVGLSALAVISAVAWRWRREAPVLSLAWLAYLALLAPAVGLVPSGLQATADRYTYVAGVPLSIAIAWMIFRRTPGFFRLKLEDNGSSVASGSSRQASEIPVAAGFSRKACAATALAVLAALSWQQTEYWRDSVTLWTRAVEMDSRNDVALYNLASALDESGRADEALARYEQVLAIVPAHDAARRNRDRLRARALEEEGNRLAASGSFQAAAARYAEAVRLDDRRSHSHAALGMALTQLGRLDDARPHLQAALNQGVADAALFNALAYGLTQSGDREGALRVLRDGQRRHPADPDIARNLALLSQR